VATVLNIILKTLYQYLIDTSFPPFKISYSSINNNGENETIAHDVGGVQEEKPKVPAKVSLNF